MSAEKRDERGARTVVLLTAETVGRGDDELGRILMGSFLETLGQQKGDLSHLLLLNGGAKLPVEGSPVLDKLRRLEEVGVEILACGTCLRYFGVEGSLAAGNVSTMAAILEILGSADRVLSP